MNNHIQLPRHRFFSLEKANSALVLVRPIVSELMEKHKMLVRVQDEISIIDMKINQQQSSQNPDEDALQIYEEMSDRSYSAMNKLLDLIAHNIEELHTVGCVLKDFQVGIVDFPTHFDGRDVYLCWQFGERDVSNWHEMEDGFSGRSPVTDHFVANSGGHATILV